MCQKDSGSNLNRHPLATDGKIHFLHAAFSLFLDIFLSFTEGVVRQEGVLAARGAPATFTAQPASAQTAGGFMGG